jgi:hypothetical protein
VTIAAGLIFAMNSMCIAPLAWRIQERSPSRTWWIGRTRTLKVLSPVARYTVGTDTGLSGLEDYD